MPVDKFGRRDYRPTPTLVNETTAVVSLSEMNDKFLRRDGTNTAVGTINMTGNTYNTYIMPFLKLQIPKNRDFMVKEFLKTEKNIQDN